MLRDITIGQHFPGNSILHTMDPRVKLLLTIAYIVMLFVGSNPAGLVISIVFLTVLYLVAKIPLKIVGKSIKPILPIILFTAVLNLFFMTGIGILFLLALFMESYVNQNVLSFVIERFL